MFGQSGILTVLGMAVVFSFLWIMVISVTFVGMIVQKLEAGKAVAGVGASGAGSVAATGVALGVIAASIAAVNEYRKTENSQ